jgi:prepilin-type N-terminal cleavage/methylation domain-containing protein
MTRLCYFKKTKSSFALVELLVAISIFGVVATVVYTTLYTSIKAYHKTQGQLRLNQEINQVLDRLSGELRNCYGADYNEDQDKGGFIADSQNMAFFTIQNTYTQGSFKKLLARLTYSFENGKLFKKIQSDDEAFLEDSDFQVEELLSDIQDLKLEYLYFKKTFMEGEYPYEWKSEWFDVDKDLVPKGVKIEITLHDPQTNMDISLKRYIFLTQGEIPTQQ